MQFIFNGTLDELKETISMKAKEHNKDILIYHNEPNTLEIGFQRLGHSGGRFYVADIFEIGRKTFLHGKLENLYPNQSQNKARNFIDSIGSWLLIYLIFAFFPVLLWLCIFQLKYIWIPIILPIPIIALCRINTKRKDKKIDDDFIKFMSMFCTYSDVELASYKPYWDDAYRRLDLARGKLQSVCDDDQDMLLITYEDGMQIDVGYIEEDKTYYITVVSSNTMESWNNPLGVFTTKDKSKLASELQKAIYKFRNN
ncbi:MAG: hypothetical protein E7269_05655 [Lachnospiraceae bacterium]|nr:hypothetical protein [Lachnospiraceae bacterium]